MSIGLKYVIVDDYANACRLRDNDASLKALEFVELYFGNLLHDSKKSTSRMQRRLLKACATTPIFKDCGLCHDGWDLVEIGGTGVHI
jgi:hypothetical protein